MKEKVLLTGATGYIGKYISSQLTEQYDIYAMSKYPSEQIEGVTWLTGDMFSLNDCIDAMTHVDFGIYFLDPNKRSSRMNDAKFRDINAISADNFARAAEFTELKAIFYVSGTSEDQETLNILRSYKTPVHASVTSVKRKGIVAQTQNSEINDVRSIQRTLMPSSWTVAEVSHHYFNWLNDMAFNIINVKHKDNAYTINAAGKNVLTLTEDEEKSDINRIVYKITDGSFYKDTPESRARMEFRRLKNSDTLIIALHDYEPTIPWLVYILTQLPIHHLSMKIFDVEMRIARFQEDKANGVEKHYTK
ncbi:NAD-dependent epimerase/dehydratase family protein [Macrococcoides canis]|uniref:NAD-dependent epimerase/dehydratase family protein n=1 Tax=Macrococcoides canis TaxID=1855823 RepID=UPI0013E95E36|nr:NAD-dependent epimerase/dehydratase family protein [Macrococcus canis]QIH75280.1 NAD-dependent epimerase/dehydratase family protein [Macrococcus canis]UTH02965.1 NAD-dependent epimerase/dehydratase family protein [Macrococcus canis]UTH07393.1 NAD-dependent epimerase/dehydratase family protein [Macrococcus canis]